MKAHRALLVAGSLWEIVRFFLVISLLALVLEEASGVGRAAVPWLLVGGTGNLVIAVGGIMLALFPRRHGGIVGLLRLGKVLSIFPLLLLPFSGALRLGAGVQVFAVGGIAITEGVVLLGVLLLDVLFLAVLASWRSGNGREEPAPEPAAVHLPRYTETEVRDFH